MKDTTSECFSSDDVLCAWLEVESVLLFAAKAYDECCSNPDASEPFERV